MDLYNIPNDTGGTWRLNNFIEYHVHGIDDVIAPMKYLLGNADKNQIIWTTFLYSTCYCLGTAMFASILLDYKTLTQQELEDFWTKYKSKLLFQSDRRYVKNMNWFVPIVSDFMKRTKRNPYKYFESLLEGNPKQVYANMYKEVCSWRYYGRFSAILFLRVLIKTLGVPMDFSEDYDWVNGATTTAGALLLGYKDEKIEPYLETSKVSPKMRAWLDGMLDKIQEEIKAQYPQKQTSMLYITSDLCSYFKLYKQSRYIGYYVDRGQAELIKLSKNLPQAKQLWVDIWKARKETIPNKYLGELNGWSGIRQGLYSKFKQEGRLYE